MDNRPGNHDNNTMGPTNTILPARVSRGESLTTSVLSDGVVFKPIEGMFVFRSLLFGIVTFPPLVSLFVTDLLAHDQHHTTYRLHGVSLFH